MWPQSMACTFAGGWPEPEPEPRPVISFSSFFTCGPKIQFSFYERGAFSSDFNDIPDDSSRLDWRARRRPPRQLSNAQFLRPKIQWAVLFFFSFLRSCLVDDLICLCFRCFRLSFRLLPRNSSRVLCTGIGQTVRETQATG